MLEEEEEVNFDQSIQLCTNQRRKGEEVDERQRMKQLHDTYQQQHRRLGMSFWSVERITSRVQHDFLNR